MAVEDNKKNDEAAIQELLDDCFQARILSAREGCLGERRPRAILGRKDGELCLGTADVTGQKHGRPTM